MAASPVLTLPTYTDRFIEEFLYDWLRRKAECVDVVLRFDRKAPQLAADRPVPERLLQEAERGLMLAENARLFRVDGQGCCVVGVRKAAERLAEEASALLKEAFELWARASGFERAQFWCTWNAETRPVYDVVVIPGRALNGGASTLARLASSYPASPETAAVLQALEQALAPELEHVAAAATQAQAPAIRATG